MGVFISSIELISLPINLPKEFKYWMLLSYVNLVFLIKKYFLKKRTYIFGLQAPYLVSKIPYLIK
jgi:hypothetical protein